MLDLLPKIRGRYTEDAPLGEKGWFRCGGRAQVLFKPADQDDLQHFLQHCPADIPVHIFGALSNTIIRDGGIDGVTIRLGKEFAAINITEDMVTAGALALDANVAKTAMEHGVGGLEFLSGIPGTIGGALRMNAGCYGVEIKDVLRSCDVLDRAGNIHCFTPDQMDMAYRHTNLPSDMIFLSATLKGVREPIEIIQEKMNNIRQSREESQPIREKTGGSTFANPSIADLHRANLPEGTKVWQLIDRVGGRGLKIGGAMMNEKHCNFMINTGDATAADLEGLGEEIRRRVLEKFGITLRWEIKRVGVRRDD